jgi:DNA invertase Pin-like site-specific DNA recombinase
VVFCDLPSIPDGPTGKFLLTQMASVAELEGGIISQRTRAALQAAKRRGVRLGGDRGNLPGVSRAGAAASVLVRQRKARERNADVLPRITAMRQEGMSVKTIAERLNDDGVPAPRGGKWHPNSVQRILVRS